MKGLVFRSTGSWYEVRGEDKRTYQCRTKGKLRLSDVKTTNPIAVGDYVLFELEKNNDTGIIYEIVERENYIVRKSIKNKNQGHIIAANIDQSVLIATLSYPRTSLGFIDRFLVSAEAFRIPQIIIFNKIDLLKSKEEELIVKFIEV